MKPLAADLAATEGDRATAPPFDPADQAEASKRIDALQEKTGRGRDP